MSKANNDADRRLVVVPLSMWMDAEMDAELERSFDRESDRMAQEEALDHSAPNAGCALEQDEICDILLEMADLFALKEAAEPDYVASVDHVLSDKLKYPLGLRFESSGVEGIMASMPIASAEKLLSVSSSTGHKRLRVNLGLAPDDELLASPVSEWSIADLTDLLDAFVDTSGVQLRIIDHLASSTDALCCDRLLDQEEYERRAARLRQIKAAEADFDCELQTDGSLN